MISVQLGSLPVELFNFGGN